MRKSVVTSVSLAFICIAAPAWAHPGHALAGGLATGLLHPLLGIDHLAAMVLVGLWAAQLGGRALWAVPIAFVSMMAVGTALAVQGIAVPAIEAGVMASLLVLGALVMSVSRLRPFAAAATVGLFALFHGAAHGQELPAMSQATAYAAGFLLATAALHIAGIFIGRWSMRGSGLLARVAGGVAVATGLVLIAG